MRRYLAEVIVSNGRYEKAKNYHLSASSIGVAVRKASWKTGDIFPRGTRLTKAVVRVIAIKGACCGAEDDGD